MLIRQKMHRIHIVIMNLTCGSVPLTKLGISSFLKPNSVKPFSIFITCMYSFTTSDNILPASLFLARLISAPSNSAASKCLSAHPLPVKENTAGAVITTERPCGTIG